MKALIYYRKSTDRDDKQANTLEHQLNNCRNTARNLWFEIAREIWESVSAKEEFKRPWFNEMIELCKKKKIDFIIIDEPKRLSRNNIDTSRIIDLLDKKCIKGIYATSRQYLGENSRDKFLLQLDLSLSKMDNEDRAKDVKDKMISCLRKGMCMHKAPFGYQNITIKKWHHEVVIKKTEAELVRIIFEMRKKEFTFNDIWGYANKHYGYMKKFEINFIQKIVNNKFYYGMMTFGGIDYPGKHKAIISKKLFDEANNSGLRGSYLIVNKNADYLLKWLLKDPSGGKLIAYMKKWHRYYWAQARSEHRVSIREEMVLEKAWDLLKEYTNWWTKQEFSKKIVIDILKRYEIQWQEIAQEIEEKITQQNQRKSELLNMRLDGKLTDNQYIEKLNELTNNIKGLEESRDVYRSKTGDFSWLYEKMIELSKHLHQTYLSSNNLQRSLILKSIMIELSIDNKKELHPQENELFNVIKNDYFPFGRATENRTPVDGMKIRCPNP